MEESLRTGRRRPPDGGRILRAAFAEVIEHCVETGRRPRARLVIGGKSMGGRVATMIADEHRVAGVVCLGYPFHPPKKPRLLRCAHLVDIRAPGKSTGVTRRPLPLARRRQPQPGAPEILRPNGRTESAGSRQRHTGIHGRPPGWERPAMTQT